MAEIKRCPICKRNKNKAIQEQSSQRAGCGVRGCVFEQEIQRAITEKAKIRAIKKPKPTIRIIKK
ncbi:MAG: hypothetical protein LBG80_01555 [Bacteroidales bacterium]|jgi:hypothetical protein|nr:hypothetical protein [Bacteroidales bacterium]